MGYNTLTFSTTKLGTTSRTWVPFDLYGGTSPSESYSQNSDGTIYLSGYGNFGAGANISTVQTSPAVPGWTGIAFGGGMYAEATISFQGQTDYNYPNGGPAFWALDVEHFFQGTYTAGWPSSPQLQNTDGSGPYDDYFEVDIMEYDAANSTYPTAYQVNYGNWYNHVSGGGQSLNAEPWADQVPGATGSVLAPAGTDFSKPHTYAVLWVPATGSGQTSVTQGYAKAYIDGAQVGETYYWNYHDPHDVAHYPKPIPVIGDTSMSGMDWRHMFLMLGTGTDQPMTVYSVSVWQASSADNLEY